MNRGYNIESRFYNTEALHNLRQIDKDMEKKTKEGNITQEDILNYRLKRLYFGMGINANNFGRFTNAIPY